MYIRICFVILDNVRAPLVCQHRLSMRMCQYVRDAAFSIALHA